MPPPWVLTMTRAALILLAILSAAQGCRAHYVIGRVVTPTRYLWHQTPTGG